MALAADTVLQNRYRIIRLLGQGGMGSVYLAIDERFDNEVAIKESHFTDDAARRQFEREARLLNRLRHPAMTKVIDHFTEGDGQFLVMEFIGGEDLWEMLQKRGAAFPVDKVLAWADQLLDALSYLHRQEPPVIHRDIKPQNLKLSDTGQIILLDFGLAKGALGQSTSIMTSRSVFGYTPVYAPLEQIHGVGTDPRSDIYSLGATLYHLITGVVPTDAPTRFNALEEDREDPLRPASEVNQEVTGEVAEVLKRAMAVNRRDRFATAAEMLEALGRVKKLLPASELEANSQPSQTILSSSTAGDAVQPHSPADTGATGERGQQPGATVAAATVWSAASRWAQFPSEQQPLIGTPPFLATPARSTHKRSYLAWIIGVLAVLVIVGVAIAYYLNTHPRTIPSGDASNQSSGETVSDAAVSVLPIEDPAGSMNSFYAALTRTEAKQAGAITRITHYGDSPITNDGLTAPVRRQLQERFGDAGHGFILIDKPWAWYTHQAITFAPGGGWNATPISPEAKSGEFGLGGVFFTANGPGPYVRFGPAKEGNIGKNFSHMDVYYLKEPGGGQFQVSDQREQNETIAGEFSEPISTEGPRGSGFYDFKAKQSGPNTFDLSTLKGTVHLFGVVLENDGPGVVYDSLGVNGAYAGLLVTAMDERHWAEQLQHRNPNLVILNYGTMESQDASPDQMQHYERDLHEVIRRVRSALPNASILIVSPIDRGKRVAGGKIITMPTIPLIVEMQRRVALAENVAFFNMYQAMGGEGTMAKWREDTGENHQVRSRPLVGGDLTHPTAEGAEIIGTLLYKAISDGYAKYKSGTGK